VIGSVNFKAQSGGRRSRYERRRQLRGNAIHPSPPNSVHRAANSTEDGNGAWRSLMRHAPFALASLDCRNEPAIPLAVNEKEFSHRRRMSCHRRIR
jgi:hypothetical protein